MDLGSGSVESKDADPIAPVVDLYQLRTLVYSGCDGSP